MNTWEMILTQFHWLRPLWLLALIPAILLGIALWRQKRGAHQWQQVIAPELLPFLIDGETTRAQRWHIWAIIAAWIIATLALAGPAWEKRPMPVQKNENALVLILDLSPSMLTEDIKPSRLIRARLKIADILRERKDGLTALIVYAGESHVVTPLTDDTATINSLLTSLHPNIMPLPGSNTESAVTLALRLLQDAGLQRGDLLLITDGVVSDAQSAINQQLDNNVRLSILGVGSDSPAPIPGNNGGFVRDSSRAIVTTQLNSSELRSLAQQSGGRYSDLTNDKQDIETLLALPTSLADEHRAVDREFDTWHDNGHWLVFLLLPVVFFCFRRGVLPVLLLAPLLSLYTPNSQAFEWSDLWLTQDQQGQRALEQGDATRAAEAFESPEWKGSAQYRAGDYEAAAKHFAQNDTADAHYNRGNALAKSGKLDEALKAYDEALKRNPDLADAASNRALVEALKQQQEQQKEQQNQQNQDGENQDDQDSEQNQDQQQNSSEQNNEQKNQQDQQQNQNDQQQQSDSQQQQNQQDSEQQNGQQSSATQSSAAGDSGEQSSEQAEQQEQQAAQQSSTPGEEELEEMRAALEEGLSDEEKQAMEQWLRRVPDDPGGLLRNKFRYQYQQKRDERHRNMWQTPTEQENDRW